MATYVVVDSNNQWLYYGHAKRASEALVEALKATDYDQQATLYVYRVAAEYILEGERSGNHKV